LVNCAKIYNMRYLFRKLAKDTKDGDKSY
jgi:hypothetical protein